MPRAEIDACTLLCESCGYVVEGLDPASACPECGKPIAESLPERRIGTPYQQRPTLRNLAKTWWMTVRHPIRTLDVMAIHRRSASKLGRSTLVIGMLFAGMAGPLAPAAILTNDVIRITSPSASSLASKVAINSVALFVMPAVLYGVVVAVLGTIEATGLTLFMRRFRRQSRGEIARSICAHGAVGWLVCGVCFGLLMTWNLLNSFTDLEEKVWALAGLGIALVGVLAGFLFFEVFAYLGLRRLKYANRPRPPSGDST